MVRASIYDPLLLLPSSSFFKRRFFPKPSEITKFVKVSFDKIAITEFSRQNMWLASFFNWLFLPTFLQFFGMKIENETFLAVFNLLWKCSFPMHAKSKSSIFFHFTWLMKTIAIRVICLHLFTNWRQSQFCHFSLLLQFLPTLQLSCNPISPLVSELHCSTIGKIGWADF